MQIIDSSRLKQKPNIDLEIFLNLHSEQSFKKNTILSKALELTQNERAKRPVIVILKNK